MKVLYIGHYNEFGGWANAANNLIQCLHKNDIDVVTRNIKLTNTNISNNIEFESKDLNNVDYCIQHVLPHHLVGTKKFKKNIAYFVAESVNLKNHIWIKYLKLVDEIWVPNQDNKRVLNEVGFNNVEIVPHTFNIEKYKNVHHKIDFHNKRVNNAYKFYTIADLNDRKNLDGILRTYYNAFSSVDNVVLVLKMAHHGINQQKLNEIINNKCMAIQKQLRTYANSKLYPQINIFTHNLSNEQILHLHNTCDCFINLSHGEAWSIPSFEAMCFGNHPICTGWGGPKEYIDNNNINTGKLINYVLNVCNHSNPAFPEIFTGKEFWPIPSEHEASEYMRYYYENNSKNIEESLNSADRFNYTNVGNIIKEKLNNEN